MGRPTLEINLEDLGKLAGLQCTQAEAAAFFGCSEPTIKRRLQQEKYRAVWEEGQAKGRVSLRRSQFRMAETNATMAIWLGKQYLGQRDVMVHQGGDTPIPHEHRLSPELHELLERIVARPAK